MEMSSPADIARFEASPDVRQTVNRYNTPADQQKSLQQTYFQ
jgi:hypothetical protein